jgi:signal transduction histidine kinase
VDIDATLDGSAVRFSVRDTGSGIPREYQSRVFERFFRVPGQNGAGIGLGLAIAREIVQAHDGTLSMESQEGAGATFCLTLPLCQTSMHCSSADG